MGILLAITLVSQAILFSFTAVSFAAPAHRIWPPPSRNSWQFHATWFLSWVSLSGVFLLALLAGNTLGLATWLRIALGVPLLSLGALLIVWGFRTLSVSTTLGLPGAFVRSGPYQFSRNPQYLGACLYLAALVVLSGSHLAAAGCLAVALWFVATPFVEEPWLAERYGAEYEAYRRAVPRFLGFRPPINGPQMSRRPVAGRTAAGRDLLKPQSRAAFLSLVLAQAAHSIEEYVTRLYEVFTPARFVSSLLSTDLATGFAVANAALVAFGAWCWAFPIRSGWRSARGLAWSWALLELGNGVGHSVLCLVRGTYFQGALTAPILFVLAAWLVTRLARRAGRPANVAG